MYTDKRLQELSDLLELDKWEKERKPIYIADLKAILNNLNEPKYYKGAYKDLENYIHAVEDSEYLTEIGFNNFTKLLRKLESWQIIPIDNGSEERKTEDSGYTDDGVIKETQQKIDGIIPD